jgi:ribonuclease P protein component
MGVSYRFKRTQRLCKASDFKKVFKNPCRTADAYLTILAKPNGLAKARLGLIVAKKQIKAAVARNRIKRLIRESFRHHQDILTGLDCIVLVKKSVQQLDNLTLLQLIVKHWQKLSYRCKTYTP